MIQERESSALYYLNDLFSDLRLKDGDTGKTYNCHRVVLASSSTLLRSFLSTASDRVQDLNKLTSGTEFIVPRRYIRLKIQEEDNIIMEQIVLRYIYEN
jgi:hypothetical protein